MIRIGVTETYDPAYCIQDWYGRYDEFDLVIFITKSLSDRIIQIFTEDEHWNYRVKSSIIHLTVTGHGGTAIEPNVVSHLKMRDYIKKLIKAGYPSERLVLRIDPIIPTSDGIQRFIQVLMDYKDLGISRVRVSVLDMYNHVRARLQGTEFEDILKSYTSHNFRADLEWFNLINEVLEDEDVKHLKFESCAEALLSCDRVGCVSSLDLRLNHIDQSDLQLGNQRYGCLCLAKKQLIPYGMSRGRCPNKCLYCYLKDNSDY